VDSSTAGAVNVAITGGASADLSKWAAVDSLSIAGNMDATATVTYKAGNLTATVDATQDAADELNFSTNDVTASKTATLELTLNNDVGELSTGTTDKTDFDIVNIGTGTKPRKIDEIDMDGNATAVTIVGQNDITVTGNAAAGTVHIETTKDVAADGVAAATGFVTITADAINITNDVTATNDAITLTATNEVTVDDVAVSGAKGGNVDITGATVTANDITAGNDVMLTATNDTAASTANDVLAEGDVSIDSGKWTVASLTANDGTLTLSGDAKVTVSGSSNATEGITVTSSCDVDLGSIGNDATVLNASGASGGVKANFNGNYGSQVTVVTNSGDDNITANNDVVFNINTGAGNDTVTITSVDGLSVINTGAGDDTLKVNDTDNDYSVYGGAGTDGFTIAADANANVYGNDGDDTFTVGADAGAAIDGGNDTDTVILASNDYSGDGMTWSNIEKVNIKAGNATIDATTFASDNTFQLMGTGSETLTINAKTGVAATINASGVTTGDFQVAGVVINGDSKADTLTASNYSDTINGGGGDDKIYGGTSLDNGNDTLNGDAGNDTISGGDGKDIISGGADNDILTGGAGNDTITGDAGQDDMTGGSGNDTFTWDGSADTTGNDAANDADVITDFKTGEDTIDLSTANDSGGALREQSVEIVDGTNDASFAATLSAAETFFNSGAENDVYVSVNAFDSGNAYVFIDVDNDGSIDDDDIIIILTGVDDATNDIAINDFNFT
jgi:Ca2+-binding RTX toxin-like protein